MPTTKNEPKPNHGHDHGHDHGAVRYADAPAPEYAAEPVSDFAALLGGGVRATPAAAAFGALLGGPVAAGPAAEAARRRQRMMCRCGNPWCPSPGADGYGLKPVDGD